LSEPVEFSVEQYAVLRAAVDEAFKKGKESVSATAPTHSFANCNVHIQHSGVAGGPADPHQELTPVSPLVQGLISTGAPDNLLKMALLLTNMVREDIQRNPNNPLPTRSIQALSEVLKDATEKLTTVAKGDTAVQVIHKAALDVILLAFVIGQKNGVWDEVLGG
jgi:hypothetical protein